MSANVYNVESLLVGHEYFSKSVRGKIVRAEKHPHAVWYENAEAYLVEIKPEYGSKNTYRTLAVSN